MLNRLIRTIVTGVLLLVAEVSYAQLSPGKLSEDHAQLEGVDNCTQCHDVGKSVSNSKCLKCHTEIDQLVKQRRGYHSSKEVKGQSCVKCHNEHHGRNFKLVKMDSTTFNHDLTGYQLKGAHAQLNCKQCHQTRHIRSSKLRKKTSTYLGLDSRCTSCHTDYHQGKMGTDCASCHNAQSFKNPKPFNHTATRFPLKGKHAAVSCNECHKPIVVKGVKVQKYSPLNFANCNACHTDPHTNKLGPDCKSCHVETSFSTIKNRDGFDHDKTNYKLEGKHKTVSCKECHTSGNYTKPLKYALCTDCHTDHHKGQLDKKGRKADCASCHSVNGFTPSSYSIENHQKSDFPLEGAHQAVSCNECHVKNQEWVFKKLGEACVDCHTNVHKDCISKEKMPANECTICHVQDKWTQVSYNHDLTGYKLEGKHARVSCRECHYRPWENGKPVQQFKGTSRECSACHTDSHQGQFEVDGKTDCLRCHTYEKWNPSVFNHDTARFKLDGQHARLACSECHKEKVSAKGKFIEHRFNDISCASCHSDKANVVK